MTLSKLLKRGWVLFALQLHTNAQNVKNESILNGLVDQLVRKGIEAYMSRKFQVPDAGFHLSNLKFTIKNYFSSFGIYIVKDFNSNVRSTPPKGNGIQETPVFSEWKTLPTNIKKWMH